MARRLAAAVAALGLSMLLVAPALATVPLHQTPPIDWNDVTFQGTAEDCADTNLDPGQVLWHFVLANTSDPNVTLTATFGDASANVVNLSSTKVTDHYVVMWEVITGETSLTGASSSANDGILNLSHICAGSPPPEIPEAPASALLMLSAGVGLLALFRMRQRRSGSVA